MVLPAHRTRSPIAKKDRRRHGVLAGNMNVSRQSDRTDQIDHSFWAINLPNVGGVAIDSYLRMVTEGLLH